MDISVHTNSYGSCKKVIAYKYLATLLVEGSFLYLAVCANARIKYATDLIANQVYI